MPHLSLSNPKTLGQSARLVSTFESPDRGRCLEFWYYRSRPSNGKLNAYITTNASDNESTTLVWSRNAITSELWRKAQIPTEYSTPFRVIFESVIGNSTEVKIVNENIRAYSCLMLHRKMLLLTMFGDYQHHV